MRTLIERDRRATHRSGVASAPRYRLPPVCNSALRSGAILEIRRCSKVVHKSKIIYTNHVFKSKIIFSTMSSIIYYTII